MSRPIWDTVAKEGGGNGHHGAAIDTSSTEKV